DAYEEIDLVARGGNYGWNVMEGMHCYNASSCATAGLALPLVEDPHTLGCSVTGGFVNRGATELRGVYLYADFCSGRIWGLRYQGGRIVAQAQVGRAGFSAGSSAQDRAGRPRPSSRSCRGRGRGAPHRERKVTAGSVAGARAPTERHSR